MLNSALSNMWRKLWLWRALWWWVFLSWSSWPNRKETDFILVMGTFSSFHVTQRLKTLFSVSNLNLPPGVSAPHGAMQYVVITCFPILPVHRLNSGFMSALYILISPNPTSSRYSSPSGLLNLSTFIGIQWLAVVKDMLLFSASGWSSSPLFHVAYVLVDTKDLKTQRWLWNKWKASNWLVVQ